MTKPTLTVHPTGTCFDDALDLIEQWAREGRINDRNAHTFRVVHGILVAPNGERYSHAWIEELSNRDGLAWFGGIIGDMRAVLAAPIDEYRNEMQVIEFTAYTLRHAFELNRTSGHYGPWEERYRALCRTKENPK